jgi:hypothetical protein
VEQYRTLDDQRKAYHEMRESNGKSATGSVAPQM